MQRAFRWAILAILMPALAPAQIMRGVTEVPTDTVHRGLFFELGGPGQLYSVNYEQHLRMGTVAQVGFSRWSAHFFSPRRASRAGILTLFQQVAAPDVFSEYVFGEFGGGIVGGEHLREDWEYPPQDSLGAQPTLRTARSPWLALTGLIGLRFQPINGGLTFRLGWTPLLVLRDLEQNARGPRMNVGVSMGYTW